MREYLKKLRLIKARKSGAYSRLLQRFKKRWQLAKNNGVATENPDIRITAEVSIEEQCEDLPEEVPMNFVDELPSIPNNDPIASQNSSKNLGHSKFSNIF